MATNEPKNLIFIGSKKLGLEVMKAIFRVAPSNLTGVISFDDSDDTRSVFSDFKKFCRMKNVDLTILKKPSELSRVIEEKKPDLCIVVGWYWIIKRELLEKVPLGVYGVHASLLPRYRGCSPLVWAVINGENQHGVTLFRFDDGMDTGDIFAQKTFVVDVSDYISDVLLKVESETLEIIREFIPLMLAGDYRGKPQDHKRATYCAQRRPEDGHIDWNHSSYEIYNFIRAQSRPYPGAFTILVDGRTLRIWRAEVFPAEYYGVPGVVAQVTPDNAIVTCGDGALSLLEVQADDGEPISAKKILKYGMRLT